jgi:chain length determinant protein tyrosine kinase EpsG
LAHDQVKKNASAEDGALHRSIGAILTDAGRLTADGVKLVLRLQHDEGILFGDAAVKLSLVSRADIDYALSRQFNYPYLLRGQSAVSEEVVAAYEPFSMRVEGLRALRSQLMIGWFSADVANRSLAIVSAERKEGRSFIAANLAVVFSQLGAHTLLIDADLRNPYQHKLFGISNRIGLSSMLAGRAGRDAIHRIPGLLDLSVLPAGSRPPNPSELLARPGFRRLVQELSQDYSVIILDTTASRDNSDALSVSMSAGAAMIVVRKNTARVWEVRGVADEVTQKNVTLVGTVLNDY